MKKQIILGIGVTVSIAVSALAYSFSYPVQGDGSNLEEQLNQFYNRGHSVESANHIELYDFITVGKTKYVLLELNQQIGVATLVRGITGGYKIERLSTGDGNFKEWIADSGDKRYLFFGGRNIGSKIASITFTLEGQAYSMDIPEKPRFFVHLEMDDRIESNHLDLDTLNFYNNKNEDITNQVDWNGSTVL